MEIYETVCAVICLLALFIKVSGYFLARKFPNAAKWATEDLDHDFGQLSRPNQ